MSVIPAPLSAQVSAEIRMRLRSIATPLALAAFCAAAFLWIPDPGSNSASLAWELDGRMQAPLYSAGYVGMSVATLSCIFLPLGGFYLVAGSVRRDRERGVGAILAATPLSKTAYLGGKFAAHFAYLLVLDLFALLTGLVVFLRYGTGPFSPAAFAGPFLVLTVPVIAIVASLAVLFDVTPGLRGRGGLVVWFFFVLFGLIKLPFDLAGIDDDPAQTAVMSRPVFDPAGVATDQWILRESLPKAAKNISAGHVSYGQRTIERVPWKGIRVTPGLVAMRAGNLVVAAIPLLLAVAIFDRFDPARGRRHARKPGLFGRASARFRRVPEILAEDGPLAASVKLTPVTVNPSVRGAILAEARLIWESAGWIKWPLAVSAILAGVLPGNLGQGIFLLLLVPVVAEAAAREDLSGTRALVYSQPAVPRSAVLWKAAAVALFLGMLGTPMAIHGFAISPVKGVACLVGLAAVAGVSVAFGSLTSGGKLFSGVYLAVWYMAMSNLPEADFAASLSTSPKPIWSLLYMGVAAVLLGGALMREKLRRTA